LEGIGNEVKFAMAAAGYSLRNTIKEWILEVFRRSHIGEEIALLHNCHRSILVGNTLAFCRSYLIRQLYRFPSVGFGYVSLKSNRPKEVAFVGQPMFIINTHYFH